MNHPFRAAQCLRQTCLISKVKLSMFHLLEGSLTSSGSEVRELCKRAQSCQVLIPVVNGLFYEQPYEAVTFSTMQGPERVDKGTAPDVHTPYSWPASSTLLVYVSNETEAKVKSRRLCLLSHLSTEVCCCY